MTFPNVVGLTFHELFPGKSLEEEFYQNGRTPKRQSTQGLGRRRSTEQGTPETQGGNSAEGEGGGSRQSSLEQENRGAEGGSGRPMGQGEDPPLLSVRDSSGDFYYDLSFERSVGAFEKQMITFKES